MASGGWLLVLVSLWTLCLGDGRSSVWTPARPNTPLAASASSSIPFDGVSRFHVVESLPVGDFALKPLPGSASTAEALVGLFDAATSTLDILAMYWNLLAGADAGLYSPTQMREFGADRGVAVVAALQRAVTRGVDVRVVGSASDRFGTAEIASIVHAIRYWNATHDYGGGIMHQKMVVVDGRHAYLGSANMDWKSLAQVMEVGVVVESVPAVADDLQRLFNLWWHWAGLNSTYTPVDVFSDRFQATLRLPPWARDVPPPARVPTPFQAPDMTSVFNATHNLAAPLEGRTAHVFVSAAPEAATAWTRTPDEDALVYTLRSARRSVCLSVMDFEPFSTYPLATHRGGSIHWPALTDAILSVVMARNVSVRVLVSHWQHTSPRMLPALARLLAQTDGCPKRGVCAGQLEVRAFEVPGWNATVPTPGTFPPFSRVNHAKFIVSDTRANVGTSNMEWGYFYTTAGASFNTDDDPTVAAVQAIFDRNWHSAYAHPLPTA